MSTYEYLYLLISIIFSSISLGVSFFNLFRARKETKMGLGNLEIILRGMITESRNRIDDLFIEFNKIEYLGKSEEAKAVYKKAIFSAVENSLNVYNKACTLYLEGKIDKKRFKKDYKNEIKNLMNNDNYIKQCISDPLSDFGAIKRVSKEWFNTESKDY